MDERSRVYRAAGLRAGSIITAIAVARVIQLILDSAPLWVRILVFAVYGGAIFVLCLVQARREVKPTHEESAE